jgi:membrane fusion protein (multidrug efflux system)
MKVLRTKTLTLLGIALALPGIAAHGQQLPEGATKITVAVVRSKPATTTQRYYCRISSQRHIEIRAPEDGYLEEIAVREGQAVKKGDLLFKFAPVIHQARLDAELAEVQIAELEFNNTKRLFASKTVSEDELQLHTAKLAKAKAKAALARAELDFTTVKAPFDGLVDGIPSQQGSLVLKGETLTNLYENSVMRADFNVPEANYLKHMAGRRGEDQVSPEMKLTLADHTTFPHAGKLDAIKAAFDSKTGTIVFRADFPNPEGLLRHGQTGIVSLDHELKDAIVIPQRAAFEDVGTWWVYLVDKARIAHRQPIVIQNETEDQFIVKQGVETGDTIVVDGVERIRDGEKLEGVELDRDEQKAKSL